jgi:hypothetical protein
MLAAMRVKLPFSQSALFGFMGYSSIAAAGIQAIGVPSSRGSMFFVPARRDRGTGHCAPKPLFLLKNRTHLCGCDFSAIVLSRWCIGVPASTALFHPTTQ